MYLVDSRTVAGSPRAGLKPAQGSVGEWTLARLAPGSTDRLWGCARHPRQALPRIAGDAIRPYYTRKDIDATGLMRRCFAGGRSVRCIRCRIQGSGKIQLEGWRPDLAGGAEQNGHPFPPNATSRRRRHHAAGDQGACIDGAGGWRFPAARAASAPPVARGACGRRGRADRRRPVRVAVPRERHQPSARSRRPPSG